MASGLNQSAPAQWSSRWVFVLATTGAAVGLGNIWRFPYIAGENGGGAFMLLYCLCVVLIGLPIMLAEMLIGKLARRNPIDAIQDLAQESHASIKWRYLGCWGALGLLMVLSFYSVVAGWSLAYLWRVLSGGFYGMSAVDVANMWVGFSGSAGEMLLWHSVFMCMVGLVAFAGVQSGLERATKLLMPALYGVLFSLVAYAYLEADFTQAWHFLFDFRWESVTSSVLLAAMGHAFFTLALGAGALLTYGAYAPKKVNLIASIAAVAFLDVLVALLSGLAIFPWVFLEGLSPDSGAGLMFQVLPTAFAQLPYGNLLGILFYCLLWFAAWTSAINIAEPLVVILTERYAWSRKKAVSGVMVLAWFLGIGSILSFNDWSDLRLMGHWTVFDFFTSFVTDWILPLGGLGFAWFVGRVLSKQRARDALSEVPNGWFVLWWWLLRYVAPTAIVMVFIEPIWHFFHM